MKYLINIETKQHIPYRTLYDRSKWLAVETDSEGWIPHTGNECPLPDDVPYEVKLNLKDYGGDITTSSGSKPQYRCWGTVSHYRPILEPEKVQETEPHPTEFQKSCVEAMQKRFYPEPAARNNELLDRLKAAHEHAQQIPDLEAELREVLGSMGYDLVARSPFVESEDCGNPTQCWEPCGDLGKSEAHVAVSPEPDMTDWRNWLPGDYFTCVDGNNWEKFVTGGAYKCTAIEKGWVCIEGVWVGDFIRDFRFHSRPAKGEK